MFFLFSDGFNRSVFRERIHTSIQKCYAFETIVIETEILLNVGRSRWSWVSSQSGASSPLGWSGICSRMLGFKVSFEVSMARSFTAAVSSSQRAVVSGEGMRQGMEKQRQQLNLSMETPGMLLLLWKAVVCALDSILGKVWLLLVWEVNMWLKNSDLESLWHRVDESHLQSFKDIV